MCKHVGCYNAGHAKYGGFCRKHAPPEPLTTTPTKVLTASAPTKGPTLRLAPMDPPPDEKGASRKTVSTFGGKPSVTPRCRFIHRWGCEYLILTADGRIPVGDRMPVLMAALIEAMPVATHAGRASTARVGAALEGFADDIGRYGLVLFPVPRTLYELLIAVMPCTFAESAVRFEGFAVADVIDLQSGKPSSIKVPAVTCPQCEVRAWVSTSHKEKPKEIAAYYASLRQTKEHVAFRLYANAWVASQLLAQPFADGVIIHRFFAAAMQALTQARKRACSSIWSQAFTALAGLGARKDIPQMILATMLSEFEPCPDGEPGFLLYRGTGKYPEASSLESTFDLSYAMSLFGGWFFDGPTQVTSSACTMQYLLTASGSGQNYWILRIKWSEFLDPRGSYAILQHLLLPAIPVSIQLFGFKGGFHARMWKRDPTESSVIRAFMKAHHLSFKHDPLGADLVELMLRTLLPGTSSNVDLASLAAAELVDIIERLDHAARRRGWVRHPVPGGGDCLYHAVLTHFSLGELGVALGPHPSEVAALRDALATFFESNPDVLDDLLHHARLDTAGLRQERNDHHEGADLMPYLIQRFISSKGLPYNLRIYRFTDQLQITNLGQPTDGELPIAQWQNYSGGHFDPMLPVLEPA